MDNPPPGRKEVYTRRQRVQSSYPAAAACTHQQNPSFWSGRTGAPSGSRERPG